MIYVMSDIHGNLRRFKSILKQIRLQPEDTLYILGDVIDRYPHGIRILRMIMKMPNAVMLLGNHEHMMLRVLQEPYDASDWDDFYDLERFTRGWYRNGGAVTHRSLKYSRKSIRQEICAYLKALPLNIDITVNGKSYKLVHGAPVELYEPGVPPYQNRSHFAVWKRLEGDAPVTDDCTLIFGHSATHHYQSHQPMQIFHGPNMIGIDCGSGYSSDDGRLACLRLDDMAEFYSEC